MWVPRFVYNDNGEIGYIKEETIAGEGWTLPDLFMYKIADTTKPDFSLTGVWVQKDVDTTFANKITQMNQEESIYGFIANTKATQITTTDTNTIQKYIVGNDALVVPFDNITNLNRIILKIVDNTKHEPIKANITHNTVDKKIEIRVTYTANGISQILDEYGNTMTLTEENGIILADTGDVGLAKGTYHFTVIDNNGNKKELNITPNVDSLFKVAYTNGTDNMDINATYTKTQATSTTAENTLLTNIRAATPGISFSKAVSSSGGATAIGQKTRTSADEQMYLYGKYKANSTTKHSWINSETTTVNWTKDKYSTWGIKSVTTNSSTGEVKFGEATKLSNNGGILYSKGSTLSNNGFSTTVTGASYYKWSNYSSYANTIDRTYYKHNTTTTYSRGDFDSNVIALDGTYTIGSSTAVHKDGYWYVRNSLAPKYTLYKYDQDLTLKSIYDVDTKTLTTESIDISNKGRNKVKLTLNMYSSNYKVYISSDNTNWQEVTDITSGTSKELDVEEWDKLYVKVETNIGVSTNTTRINNIDIAYYKD